jgi:hypothetical protein
MNILLLAVLASCPPGGDLGCQQAPAPAAAYPGTGPAPCGASHQGRPRLFGWLRGLHHHNKCPCAGNGHADSDWTPEAVAPAPAVGTGTAVEAVTPETAPAVVAPPVPAEQAPRLVPRPLAVPSSAEPALAAPPDGAPHRMPRGVAVPTGAEPPGK